MQRAASALSLTLALGWHKLYWVRYHFLGWYSRHKSIFLLTVIIMLICINAYFSHSLQSWLEDNYLVQNRLDDLRSLFLQLGSALIAAAAIAFSLVMFAMQVNVERVPHGLFRKFSTDTRLLASFLATLFLAICIACASLIPDISWVAVATLGSAWGIILIFVLFWYAYRRALILINPLEQLSLMIKDTRSEMKAWVRRAMRAAPLFQRPRSANEVEAKAPPTTHDYSRLAYFQANPHWTAGTQTAIQYAGSFARRYAEHGDHEVSGAALRAIVIINQDYVEAKGKTFSHNPPFFENPLSTDEFINSTLELLRQSMRICIACGDEQQIEQTLRAMAALVNVYLAIDYSDEYASKHHAHLAAGYLSDAVQAVVPHNMADVLMEGVRLMGQSAHLFLRTKTLTPELVTTLTDQIGLIACTGIANEKYRPVTLTAIYQLAKLTFTLIRTDIHNIRFIADNLKKNVAMVAKLFLTVPTETFFESPLKSYFSTASPDALLSWLTFLVNAVLEAESEDEAADKVIRNIEIWADGLHRSQKELLLKAIEKRSRFTFDMIHWIADVAKLLMAVSNASPCDDHSRDKLRKHALWLMYTLSWIPDDKETVSFVEAFQLTETLFEVATEAYDRECSKIFDELKELLLGWAFKGGRHKTGWGILERSLYGLATLSLMGNSSSFDNLKLKIAGRLTQPNAPDQEIRDRTARDIRQKAVTLFRQDRWILSLIERKMSQMDHVMMKSALEELANILSPHTSDEPVDIDLGFIY